MKIILIEILIEWKYIVLINVLFVPVCSFWYDINLFAQIRYNFPASNRI